MLKRNTTWSATPWKSRPPKSRWGRVGFWDRILFKVAGQRISVDSRFPLARKSNWLDIQRSCWEPPYTSHMKNQHLEAGNSYAGCLNGITRIMSPIKISDIGVGRCAILYWCRCLISPAIRIHGDIQSLIGILSTSNGCCSFFPIGFILFLYSEFRNLILKKNEKRKWKKWKKSR